MSEMLNRHLRSNPHSGIPLIPLLAALMLLFLAGCGQRDRSLHLIRWPGGTNDGYAINVAWGAKDYAVVIPDVHSIRNTEGFVIGQADWKYLGKYMQHLDAGIPATNEFWFALNKRVLFPKCCTLLTTNEPEWVRWCDTNHLSTNLQGVAEFMLTAPPATRYIHGIPWLRL